MTWLSVAEHAALMQRVKDRTRRQRSAPSGKGEWSPIAADPAGGWWLYGEHYDTEYDAQRAWDEQRRGGVA